MMPIPNRDAVALSARTLARCSLMRRIAQHCAAGRRLPGRQLAATVALPVTARWRQRFAASTEESLPEAWQRLFIGPWALPAPPWDPSGWIKSQCCLAIPRWPCASGCARTGIALDAERNEPEDHFGTLLLLAAWLCETEQDALFAQLLDWHLLPWSGRLSVFVDHAAHPFYRALGQLAQATLAQWQENLPIAVAEKALYR